MSEDVAPAHPYSPRQPQTLVAQPNGFSKPPTANGLGSPTQYMEEDQGHLVPNRVNELHKKGSGDVSANSSDPDSVLEYYKAPDARNGAATKSKGRKKGGKQPSSKWVRTITLPNVVSKVAFKLRRDDCRLRAW